MNENYDADVRLLKLLDNCFSSFEKCFKDEPCRLDKPLQQYAQDIKILKSNLLTENSGLSKEITEILFVHINIVAKMKLIQGLIDKAYHLYDNGTKDK